MEDTFDTDILVRYIRGDPVDNLQPPDSIWIGTTDPAQEFADWNATQMNAINLDEFLPDYLRDFRGVFEKKAAERFPISRPYDHAIELKPGFIPRNYKPYPLSPRHEKAMNDFIDENLRKGYIRKSTSPMASPLFFVDKKDDSLRPCRDYRYLNEGTVKNAYPLPLVQTLIDKLHGSTIFTKLDLRSEYNNVCIKDGDQWRRQHSNVNEDSLNLRSCSLDSAIHQPPSKPS